MEGILTQEKTMFDIKFGYKSFKDLFSSFFGTWYPVLGLVAGIVISIFYFGVPQILKHIDEFWFSPASTMLITLIAITIDWMCGTYGAFIRGEFSTRLAQRVVPMITMNFLFLSLMYNIIKYPVASLEIEMIVEAGYLFCKAAALYLAGVHSISALKNAVKAKLINADWADWISSKVDKHKDNIDNLT